MTLELAALTELAESLLRASGLVFLRVGAMMALLPVFGEQLIPARVRLGIAVAFTLVAAPAVGADLPAPAGLGQWVSIGGAEIVAGLFIGGLLRLLVMSLQTAGTIAAQSASLSQIFGGVAGSEPSPAMSSLLLFAGLALAAMSGLHVHVTLMIVESYDLIEAGRMLGPSLVADLGLSAASRSFSLAFQLAAPFVLASLLYNVTLGIINRAMPQLMVAFVGAPAITAGGLILLMLSIPLVLRLWLGEFSTALIDPFGMAR